MRPVGLASVLFPASVTEKLFAAEKSGVIVAPSVSAEMLDAEFPETKNLVVGLAVPTPTLRLA